MSTIVFVVASLHRYILLELRVVSKACIFAILLSYPVPAQCTFLKLFFKHKYFLCLIISCHVKEVLNSLFISFICIYAGNVLKEPSFSMN